MRGRMRGRWRERGRAEVRVRGIRGRAGDDLVREATVAEDVALVHHQPQPEHTAQRRRVLVPLALAREPLRRREHERVPRERARRRQRRGGGAVHVDSARRLERLRLDVQLQLPLPVREQRLGHHHQRRARGARRRRRAEECRVRQHLLEELLAARGGAAAGLHARARRARRAHSRARARARRHARHARHGAASVLLEGLQRGVGARTRRARAVQRVGDRLVQHRLVVARAHCLDHRHHRLRLEVGVELRPRRLRRRPPRRLRTRARVQPGRLEHERQDGDGLA